MFGQRLAADPTPASGRLLLLRWWTVDTLQWMPGCQAASARAALGASSRCATRCCTLASCVVDPLRLERRTAADRGAMCGGSQAERPWGEGHGVSGERLGMG